MTDTDEEKLAERKAIQKVYEEVQNTLAIMDELHKTVELYAQALKQQGFQIEEAYFKKKGEKKWGCYHL